MKTEKESVLGLFSGKTERSHHRPSYSICLFLIIFTLLLSSCSHLIQRAGSQPDSIPLDTEEIFTPAILASSLRDARSLTGRKQGEKEILETVNETTKKHTLYFYTRLSTDADFQGIKKEISVIRSAEEYAKLALDIIEKTNEDVQCGEKNLVFLSAVKQLLIKASKDSGPLAVKIEELIREKEWEDDGSMDSSEKFFDIMELEAEIPHLKKTGRQLYRATEKIERFLSMQAPLKSMRPITVTGSALTSP